MTNALRYSGKLQTRENKEPRDGNFYLLLFLVGMLTLFFAFGVPSAQPAIHEQALKGTDMPASNRIGRPDPASIYKAIVTDGDPIRSVLQ